MKHSSIGCSKVDALAVLGGAPAFAKAIPVGQLYFPPWDDYEKMFHSIFKCRYYTNQGPLADLLESRLADYLQVRHVVCVTNATIGLKMAAEGLGIKGRVILPSFTFIATAQSLLWNNLVPVFCDVDRETHYLDFNHLERLLRRGANAVLPVNLWGGAYDMERIHALAQRYDIPFYFDSAHGMGCVTRGRPLGGFGNAEVFSMHATKVLSAGEGGCIATNDGDLAERLRNIRSSYGVRTPVHVERTANGRMSEAQAALGLLSLDAIDANIKNNQHLHQVYRDNLNSIPGVLVVSPVNVEYSNCQYLVCEIEEQAFGLSRDALWKALHAENIIARRYFSPGVHRCYPFDSIISDDLPETEHLSSTVIQLPLGARVDVKAVVAICQRIQQINTQAGEVSAVLERSL